MSFRYKDNVQSNGSRNGTRSERKKKREKKKREDSKNTTKVFLVLTIVFTQCVGKTGPSSQRMNDSLIGKFTTWPQWQPAGRNFTTRKIQNYTVSESTSRTRKTKNITATTKKLRILQRHKRLGMNPDVPLVVYRKQKGSKKGSFFTKRGVEEKLNEARRAVYGSNPEQK